MRRSGGVSGAVSLVMIFCVLCLVIFSVLTLSTAEREYKLSEKTVRNAEEYYRADYKATVIVAALRKGTAVRKADTLAAFLCRLPFSLRYAFRETIATLRELAAGNLRKR